GTASRSRRVNVDAGYARDDLAAHGTGDAHKYRSEQLPAEDPYYLETVSANTWHLSDRAKQRWHLSQLSHGLAGPHRIQAHGLDIRRLVTCSFWIVEHGPDKSH